MRSRPLKQFKIRQSNVSIKGHEGDKREERYTQLKCGFFDLGTSLMDKL